MRKTLTFLLLALTVFALAACDTMNDKAPNGDKNPIEDQLPDDDPKGDENTRTNIIGGKVPHYETKYGQYVYGFLMDTTGSGDSLTDTRPWLIEGELNSDGSFTIELPTTIEAPEITICTTASGAELTARAMIQNAIISATPKTEPIPYSAWNLMGTHMINKNQTAEGIGNYVHVYTDKAQTITGECFTEPGNSEEWGHMNVTLEPGWNTLVPLTEIETDTRTTTNATEYRLTDYWLFAATKPLSN